MMKRAFLGFALAALVAGCATPAPAENETVERNNAAGDVLAKLLRDRGFATSPVVVASAVDVENLERTSNFGRMVSEQVAGRMAFAGVPVVELKLRTALYMSEKKAGEFMLSRELKALSKEHKAAVAVVGTYSVANSDVLVTLKAVDVDNNTVVAAHSYSVPKALVSRLLK